jgi:hypothetical protein
VKTTRGQYVAKSLDVFIRIARGMTREEARQMFLDDHRVSDEPYKDKNRGPKWRTRFAPSTRAYAFCRDIVGIGNENEVTFCEEPVSTPKTVDEWQKRYEGHISTRAQEKMKRPYKPKAEPMRVTYEDGLLETYRLAARAYLDRTGALPPQLSMAEVRR